MLLAGCCHTFAKDLNRAWNAHQYGLRCVKANIRQMCTRNRDKNTRVRWSTGQRQIRASRVFIRATSCPYSLDIRQTIQVGEQNRSSDSSTFCENNKYTRLETRSINLHSTTPKIGFFLTNKTVEPGQKNAPEKKTVREFFNPSNKLYTKFPHGETVDTRCQIHPQEFFQYFFTDRATEKKKRKENT